MPQIPAAETVATSLAVVEKGTIPTVFRSDGDNTVVAGIRVERSKTEFAVNKLVAVADVAALDDPLGVVHIFGSTPNTHPKVAVLQVERVVTVVAIDCVFLIEGVPRNFILQFLELLEEGTGKIKVLAGVQGIPCISPPAFVAIHGERSGWTIDGYNFFFTQITGSFV